MVLTTLLWSKFCVVIRDAWYIGSILVIAQYFLFINVVQYLIMPAYFSYFNILVTVVII